MKAFKESKKLQSKIKDETSDEIASEDYDEVEVEIINHHNYQEDFEDGAEIPNYNCSEIEEYDPSCNAELGSVDELDQDFIIDHYARISGYTPFRMDKEAANVLRSYLDSRFEETVSIKKDLKNTIEEFTDKALLYASSGEIPTDFISSNLKRQKTSLPSFENEKLCQAIDFLYNDSLENWSRDVSETYNKLKFVKDSEMAFAIQNLMEGKEIEVEVDNFVEEDTISGFNLAEEVTPASFTGCVDNYLMKGDELHLFNEKKKKEKKKSKPKEESPPPIPPESQAKGPGQPKTVLPDPFSQSEYSTHPSDVFTRSENSEKDDQNFDQDDRLSQYGLSIHSDDEQTCESRSISLDLLGGAGIQPFPYPLNDPDEFMKPYLLPKTLNTWRSSYSSWKERVDANARIIEETVYSNLIRQHENQTT